MVQVWIIDPNASVRARVCVVLSRKLVYYSVFFLGLAWPSNFTLSWIK